METLIGKDILRMTDLSRQEIAYVLDLAADLKSQKVQPKCNKILGLLFYKASTRTRVSFTTAMYQLGGQVIDLNPNSTQIGRGEPLADTARVLDRYLDVLAIRTFAQSDLEEFANYAKMPIINALTDWEHPCQVLADLQTIKESFGTLKGLKLTYCGDGNNMAHSLMLGCAMMGLDIAIATPENFQPHQEIIRETKEIAALSGTEVTITNDPGLAVKDAHVVYTDVWASMGQENEAADRIPLFQPYQVNDELLAKAASEAIVLHCLPAHRGEEITDSVMEGQQSKIWDQAENRMHAQKALLVSVLGI